MQCSNQLMPVLVVVLVEREDCCTVMSVVSKLTSVQCYPSPVPPAPMCHYLTTVDCLLQEDNHILPLLFICLDI